MTQERAEDVQDNADMDEVLALKETPIPWDEAKRQLFPETVPTNSEGEEAL